MKTISAPVQDIFMNRIFNDSGVILCCLTADQENLDCDFEDEESSQTCLMPNQTAKDQWVREKAEKRDVHTVCEYPELK